MGVELGPSSIFRVEPKCDSLFFFFLANSTITLESKLKLGFEFKFCSAQIHAQAQFFLNSKLEKETQIQVANFYLKLVGFLLRCVEILWGLMAFSLFLHK
jgi:heme/copper-type cytochrome/quinol oxidase subunit 4